MFFVCFFEEKKIYIIIIPSMAATADNSRGSVSAIVQHPTPNSPNPNLTGKPLGQR